MSSSEIEAIYNILLKRYDEQGFLRPKAALDSNIDSLMLKGRTREEAILELNSSNSPWTYSPPARATAGGQEKETGEQKAVLAQIANLREKIDSLTTLFSKGEITEETYRRGVRKIEEDISILQREHGISTVRSRERTPTRVSRDSEQEVRDIFKPSDTFERVEDQDRSRLHLLRKYFMHGIAFSLLFLVLGFMWGVVLGFLVIFGFVIGLVIGFGLLFLMIGWLNSEITNALWFDVEMGFWSLFKHGLVLFLVLLPIDLVFLAVRLAFPDVLVFVATFLIEIIPYGFVAEKVASLFTER